MEYSDEVMKRVRDPQNVGTLDESAADVGTGVVGTAECGDVLKLQIRVDSNDRIVETKFLVFGCGSAIASSSLATEWIKGKTLSEALAVKNTDIARKLMLPPSRLHCSVMAENAIRSAVEDFRRKRRAGSVGKMGPVK